jgi:hypothetical protein
LTVLTSSAANTEEIVIKNNVDTKVLINFITLPLPRPIDRYLSFAITKYYCYLSNYWDSIPVRRST